MVRTLVVLTPIVTACQEDKPSDQVLDVVPESIAEME